MAKRKRRRTGRGATIAIAALLITSALLRFAAGAGDALAQATPPANPPEGMEPNPTAQVEAPRPQPDLSREEVRGLLAALRAREERVKALETQIEMRSKALAVADAEIEKRLTALQEAEENLRRTIALADGAAEDDLARLTAVYESMKPKDAAALFETMEPDFAAGFLGRMRPDAAAAVMAGLTPDTAYSISVILAGRNAKAPKS